MKNHPDLMETSVPSDRRKPPYSLTRRQFLKVAISALVGAGLATGGYASFFEPRMLEVTRINLHQKRLPKAFDGMTIAHFSDLHLGFHIDVKDVKRVIGVINQERPDLICFTGDMVDDKVDAMYEAVGLLSTLDAPLGVLSIVGNHDFDNVREMMALQKKAGITVLRNNHIRLQRDGEQIAVVGLDDQLQGNPDPEKARKGIPEDMYTLLYS